MLFFLDFVVDWREETIRLAEISDLGPVLQITHDTISEIFSHYYAEGVVKFFLEHHNKEHILSDIEDGIVWLLEEDEETIFYYFRRMICSGQSTVAGMCCKDVYQTPPF